MEDERDRSQFKHVCKLCNKRYPSGKSLGGHMRSHVIANAQKAKALLKNKAPIFVAADNFDHRQDDVDVDVDVDLDPDDKNGGTHSGYGLRENPKKTWRAAIHNHNNNNNNIQQQERVCKQCGKAFQSVKALCGHMSSHSERERNFKDIDDEEDDRSWSSESGNKTHNNNNNHLDYSNSLSSKRQTRSSYSRYRSLTTATTLDSLSINSEIDQHEQEEVAICLMMLSRDHHHHLQSYSSPLKYFNLTAESSDNNSVILEGGSSSNHASGIGKRKDLNLMSSNNNNKLGISDEKLNVAQEMDNSDSGYFENGAKELESDDSVDGYFVKNYYYYSSTKNPKAEFGSGLVDIDSSDGCKKRVRDHHVGGGGGGGFSFESPESEGNSSKKIKRDFQYESSPQQKVSKFECGKCKQTFKTYQALGGHIISTHRKNGNGTENSLETSNCAKKGGGSGGSSKKVKGHKCPYCPKVFKSGQALGGHKRSHMMGGGGGGPSIRAPTPEPEPEPEPEPSPSPTHPMIDLNLPAPLEEEASGNSEFVAW